MKVVIDCRGRDVSVDETVLAVAKRTGITVPTICREAERCLRCNLEE